VSDNGVRIITVARESGSGGATIAGLLAKRLAWRLVDDPLVAEIASTPKPSRETVRRFDESVDPWFPRIMKALWRGGFQGAASTIEEEAFDADAIAQLWHRVIIETAKIGNCVTVGRGGQCLLQDRRDAFHVYVYAPLAERLKRVREREPAGSDPVTPHETDRRRSAYIKHYFGQEWTNPHLYHLMICSSIGCERTADAILSAAGLNPAIQAGSVG
jgi:cytidylate kinase